MSRCDGRSCGLVLFGDCHCAVFEICVGGRCGGNSGSALKHSKKPNGGFWFTFYVLCLSFVTNRCLNVSNVVRMTHNRRPMYMPVEVAWMLSDPVSNCKMYTIHVYIIAGFGKCFYIREESIIIRIVHVHFAPYENVTYTYITTSTRSLEMHIYLVAGIATIGLLCSINRPQQTHQTPFPFSQCLSCVWFSAAIGPRIL